MSHSFHMQDDNTITWSIFFVSLVFYLLNIDFASTGDTIYYANIIDAQSFGKLTAHQGYYILGAVFNKLAETLFGLPTDQSLALMSVVFGAGSLALAYRFFRFYLENKTHALLGVLFLFSSHRYFENSISAEIYIVQSFFIWSSYLAYERQRYTLAGISFALAMWTTPLSIMLGFWFPVATWVRRVGFAPLLKTVIPACIIYLPFFAMFYEELLWGNRGLINEDSSRQIDIIDGMTNFVIYQFKHYTALNLLLIPALWSIRRDDKMFMLTLAACIPNIYIISQLRSEDNVFILPLDIFFAYWYLAGWRVLVEHSRPVIAMLPVVVHALIFITTEQPFVRPHNRGYAEEIRRIGRLIHDEPDSILLTDWTRQMAFVYYNREQAYDPLEDGYWYERSYDMGVFKKRMVEPQYFDKYKQVYLLETWDNSRHAKLFLHEDALERRRAKYSRAARVSRYLGTECKLLAEGINKLYRCR